MWPSGEPYEGDRVGEGAYLVDGETGTLYFVPAVDVVADGWIDGFLIHCKGRHVPDAVELRVRDVLASDGRMAALRELRKLAPALRIEGVRAYLDALEADEYPPRLLPAPPGLVGQMEPPPREFDLAEYAHMWTAERDDWYVSMTRRGGALPVHRGARESVALICDDRVAATVVAHMIEAGVEVVLAGD